MCILNERWWRYFNVFRTFSFSSDGVRGLGQMPGVVGMISTSGKGGVCGLVFKFRNRKNNSFDLPLATRSMCTMRNCL